jgi:hypothetical protein
MIRCLSIFILISAFLISPGILAVDGVTEINQVRAEAGGVSPGDSPGFPVRIAEPGSYRLTGDLIIPDQSTNGIQIISDDVTLDLNGYRIQGPVVCTGLGATLNCSPDDGFGQGIFIASSQNVKIRNGTVRGAGWSGIGISGDSMDIWVDQVTVTDTRAFGFNLVDRGLITRSTVYRTGGVTIASGMVIDSVISGNSTDGIFSNNSWGLSVRGSTLNQNESQGLHLISPGLVVGNTARNNGGLGLSLSEAPSAPGYRNNAVDGNGFPIGGGVAIGPNLCDGVVCP